MGQSIAEEFSPFNNLFPFCSAQVEGLRKKRVLGIGRVPARCPAPAFSEYFNAVLWKRPAPLRTETPSDRSSSSAAAGWAPRPGWPAADRAGPAARHTAPPA